jgi:hypothetical protein
VVAVRLGAGIPIALALGAAAAGPWVLAAIALAGLLALCSRWTVPSAQSTVDSATRRIRTLAGLARVAVFASAFGVYLFPAHSGLAAPALVVVVTAADLAGVSLPPALRRWILGWLLIAAGVLIALCLVIAPADAPAPVGTPSAGGLLLATAVMFPLLVPGREKAVWGWICGSTAVAMAIAAAALYQLGPVRLGLSVTSLRDLLAAADAAELNSLLTIVVALATVPAALTTFTEARTGVADGLRGERAPATLACGIVAAVAASLAGPAIALVLAGVLAFAEVLAGLAARYREKCD